MNRKKRTAVPLGHGVFFVADGKEARVELRQIPALRKTIGPALFAGLVAAFNASERMISLVDVYFSNGGRDPAAIRNRHHLTNLIFSALFEGVSALQIMKSAGIKGILPTSQAWARLDAIRKRWADNKTLREVRHAFGHHLGADEIARGLGRLPHGRTVPAIVWFRDGPFGKTFPITLHALCAGVRMQQEDLTAIGEDAVKDGKAYPENVESLFFELLKHHGVTIPDA
jgi:hypothetical protein